MLEVNVPEEKHFHSNLNLFSALCFTINVYCIFTDNGSLQITVSKIKVIVNTLGLTALKK